MQETQTVVLEPPLYFSEENVHVWNACFHPSQNILAASLINGTIEMYDNFYDRLKYTSEDVECLCKVTELHHKSARYCQFNADGTLLATCGEDKRLGFLDANGKIAHKIKKAHESPINRVKFANNHTLLSGDDDGVVKVWDLRTSECFFEVQEQSEAITGMYYDEEHLNVITSCLDGTIAIYDLKQGSDSENRLFAISDSVDEELNGIQVIKKGKYILAPTSEGSVLLFKREAISSYVDRVQGQPGSVDAILKIDENTCMTGSEDGFVRGLSFLPNSILQVIGQHEEEENFPIQSLSLSYCKNIVASTSHDNSIKFYDVSHFVKSRANFNPSEQEGLADREINHEMKISEDQIQDEDSDSFQDQDSDQEEDKPKKKKKKKLNIKNRETQIKKDSQKHFFKDL